MMDQIAENNAGQDGDSIATVISPGRLLREARERLKMSVADAAAQIRLAPRQIEALEADDFERLPEVPFVRGFVRNYAKLLHIDAQPLLDALPQAKAATTQLTPDSVEVPFPNAYSPQRQNLIWLGAALLLAVVVVAFAVWHYTTPLEQPKVAQVQAPLPLQVEAHVVPASSSLEADVVASSSVPATPTEPPATPHDVMTKPDVAQPVAVAMKPPVSPAPNAQAPIAQAPIIKTPESQASVIKAPESKIPIPKAPDTKALDSKPQTPQVPPKPAKPATTVAVTTGNATLRLLFDDESWTEVKDKDGNLLSSQINARGSELRLDGHAPFTLAIGRAGSVQLYHRGKKVDLKPYINASSEVARLTLE
jgi:cytoskeleton protein RodZ